MATRKKHTPEQVVRKLATADRMLNEGKDVADVCRELQVSEQGRLPGERDEHAVRGPDDVEYIG
jgi:hypothetical protein